MAHRPLASGLATAALFGLSGWGLSGCDSAPTGPVQVAEEGGGRKAGGKRAVGHGGTLAANR